MKRTVKLFKPGFVQLILKGEKTSTIRPWPKRGEQDLPEVGGILDARYWFGKPYNSPQMPIDIFTVTAVTPMRIKHSKGEALVVMVDDKTLTNSQLEKLAHVEGFMRWQDMQAWFKTNYPWKAFAGEGWECYQTQWEPIPSTPSSTPDPAP